MKAVVMEIRDDNKRAVVLDVEGRFRIVANDSYRIGQTVDTTKIASRWLRPSDYRKANLLLIGIAGALVLTAGIATVMHCASKK